jgi:hypothetical protein
MSRAAMGWLDRNEDRAQEILLGVFAAWASGKSAKMKDGSDWKDVTPDNLRIKTLDGSWVSIRDAIAAYDRNQGTDGLGDS